MAKFEKTFKGDFSQTLDAIEKAVMEGLVGDPRIIDKKEFTLGNAKACLVVFDSYFFRCSNRVTLTMLVTEEKGCITVYAVGSGGGQSIYNEMSFGAEKKFISVVEKAINEII